MSRQQPIELFMPPNMLKAKVGGGPGGMDTAALQRAEAAMETLKAQFTDMVSGDVQALMTARAHYGKQPDTQARAAMMRAAHDLKGNAPTFNFPLIGRVAGSLARMMGETPQDAILPAGLIDAHVNAILVIHRQNMRDINDKTALTLCAELDARVNELLAPKT